MYDLSGPAYDIEYGDPEERSWLKLRKERSDGKEEESRDTIKVVEREREGEADLNGVRERASCESA